MAILEVKNLKVTISNQTILDNISFSLEKGEAMAIIGPNGSGKTTLFRAIIGAIPYKGEIVMKQGLHIGYVPQKIDLERDLPLTINEFLSLKNKWQQKEIYTPKTALELVNLSQKFLYKRLSELSSGEFQRVLIAWAIIDKPDLLLFDEPTASVDIAGQETVYELLHRLQDTHNLTLMLISHDLTVVYRYANKVLCLNHSQLCFGVPQDVLTTEELQKLYGSDKLYHQHTH